MGSRIAITVILGYIIMNDPVFVDSQADTCCTGRTTNLTLTPPNPQIGQYVNLTCTVSPSPSTCGSGKSFQNGGCWRLDIQKKFGGFFTNIFNDCNNPNHVSVTGPPVRIVYNDTSCAIPESTGVFTSTLGPVVVTDAGEYRCKISGNSPSATGVILSILSTHLPTTPSKTATPTEAPADYTLYIAIAAGVLGGIVLLILLIFICWRFCYKKGSTASVGVK